MTCCKLTYHWCCTVWKNLKSLQTIALLWNAFYSDRGDYIKVNDATQQDSLQLSTAWIFGSNTTQTTFLVQQAVPSSSPPLLSKYPSLFLAINFLPPCFTHHNLIGTVICHLIHLYTIYSMIDVIYFHTMSPLPSGINMRFISSLCLNVSFITLSPVVQMCL